DRSGCNGRTGTGLTRQNGCRPAPSVSRLGGSLVGPAPFPDFRHVFTILPGIRGMLGQRLLAPSDHSFAAHAKIRQPPGGGYDQMEAVEFVHDRHIEWRGGRTFFLET